jgi:SAM-dependent methyltransferase
MLEEYHATAPEQWIIDRLPGEGLCIHLGCGSGEFPLHCYAHELEVRGYGATPDLATKTEIGMHEFNAIFERVTRRVFARVRAAETADRDAPDEDSPKSSGENLPQFFEGREGLAQEPAGGAVAVVVNSQLRGRALAEREELVGQCRRVLADGGKLFLMDEYDPPAKTSWIKTKLARHLVEGPHEQGAWWDPGWLTPLGFRVTERGEWPDLRTLVLELHRAS